MIRKIFVCILCVALAGCATVTGPGVSKEEVNAAREELKMKALKYDLDQVHRLNDIADKLMVAVPASDWKERPAPFIGFTARKVDKDLKKFFDLTQDDGVVIIDIRSGSPAEEAGLKVGDIILSVNGVSLKKKGKRYTVPKKEKSKDDVEFKVRRHAQELDIPVHVGKARPRFPVVLDEKESSINAATDGKAIYVTEPLLQFSKTDDDIAVVLAHELAHAVRGHVSKTSSVRILTSLVAVTVGVVAESAAPGSGEGVMRGVAGIGGLFGAKYSRDLEREADYLSVKYMYLAGYNVDLCATLHERFAIELSSELVSDYLSTHPSSPERVARVRKAIEEIKTGDIKDASVVDEEVKKEEAQEETAVN